MKVVMISTFGPEIRGVSPYSDALLENINLSNNNLLQPLNFSYLYPRFLSPVEVKSDVTEGDLVSAFNIKTWRNVFSTQMDVIHLQYWTFLTLPCYIYIAYKARKKGIKSVLTVHNPNPHEKIPFLSYFESFLYKQIKKIVVHTDSGKQEVIKRFCVDDNKVQVIPLGIEFDHELSISIPHKKQILFFGNIRAYKGVGDLLEAWELVRNQFPDFTLLIAGRLWTGKTLLQKIVGVFLGANKEAKIINHWKSIENKQLNFDIGFVDDDQLDTYIKESTIGVFPYKWFESQSAAAARACGMGMPVLVSDAGGLPELAIDERFVFPAGNKIKLADSLVELIRLSSSDEWCVIKESQSSVVNNFSIKIVAKQHIQLYSNLSSD